MENVLSRKDAAYIPMPKGRGFTPHFGNIHDTNPFLGRIINGKQKIAVGEAAQKKEPIARISSFFCVDSERLVELRDVFRLFFGWDF